MSSCSKPKLRLNGAGIRSFVGLVVLLGVGVGGWGMAVLVKNSLERSPSLKAEVSEQETGISTLKHDIEHARMLLGETEPLMAQGRELAGLEAESLQLAAQVTEALEAVSSAHVALNGAQRNWDEYKTAYRRAEWERAKGENLDKLKTRSGRTYEEVQIVEVNAKGIKITDATGRYSIDAADLPAELLDRFQLVPKGPVRNYTPSHPKQVEYARTAVLLNQRLEEIKNLEATASMAAKDAQEASEKVEPWSNRITRHRLAMEEARAKHPSRVAAMEEMLGQMERGAKENSDSIIKCQRLLRATETKLAARRRDVELLASKLETLTSELSVLKLKPEPGVILGVCGSPEE